MKPDLQNLSFKRKLEDSDNKDQLCLKKIQVDNDGVGSDFEDGNYKEEWLKKYPIIHATDKRHWMYYITK